MFALIFSIFSLAFAAFVAGYNMGKNHHLLKKCINRNNDS